MAVLSLPQSRQRRVLEGDWRRARAFSAPPLPGRPLVLLPRGSSASRPRGLAGPMGSTSTVTSLRCFLKRLLCSRCSPQASGARVSQGRRARAASQMCPRSLRASASALDRPDLKTPGPTNAIVRASGKNGGSDSLHWGPLLPGRMIWGKDCVHLNLGILTRGVGTASCSSEVARRVRGPAPKAWHMRSRLPGGSVTAKGTVLFTAPPASAWQLCLPVLYLIPPAKLAGQGPALKEISLPDPWTWRRRPCASTSAAWLEPGCFGSAASGQAAR